MQALGTGNNAGMADDAGSDSTAVEYLDARPLIEVEDIAAALEFFTGIAGMDVEETLGDPVMFAILNTGGARFAVAENEEPAIPAGAAVYLTMVGLDTFVDRAERAGVTFVSPITERRWGVRDVVIDCPGGGPPIAFAESTTVEPEAPVGDAADAIGNERG